MTRDIPASVRQDLEAPTQQHALLAFVTITHPQLEAPIRVVADPIDHVYQGNTYTGILFGFRLLTDEDTEPTCELSLPNVDRRIGEAIRASGVSPKIQLVILSSADFDKSVVPRAEIGAAAAVYQFVQFELRDVTADAVRIAGTVALRDYSTEPWPSLRATETRLPGLFR